MRFWKVSKDRSRVNLLARVRMGSLSLAMEEGRWAQPRVPRGQRLCLMCGAGVIEDEMHFLLECERYAEIRQRFADLCAPDLALQDQDEQLKPVL